MLVRGGLTSVRHSCTFRTHGHYAHTARFFGGCVGRVSGYAMDELSGTAAPAVEELETLQSLTRAPASD